MVSAPPELLMIHSCRHLIFLFLLNFLHYSLNVIFRNKQGVPTLHSFVPHYHLMTATISQQEEAGALQPSCRKHCWKERRGWEEIRFRTVPASCHGRVYLHRTCKQRSQQPKLFSGTKVRFPNTGKLLPVRARTGLWPLVQSPDRIRTRSTRPAEAFSCFSFYLAF